MDPQDLIQSIGREAQEWRRQLHRHPQTMYEETFASDFVAKKLAEWGIPHTRGFATTGIAASIEGRRKQSGKSVAFRADMDALNIEEASGQPWASQIAGKMHACGHDGHTSTILALARYLSQTRNFDGVATLIFQPGEEGGLGARRMLADGLLEQYPFDEIYGFHNWPFLPRGVFALRSGPMLAAVDEFQIKLEGQGGHAAMPHNTHDVIPVAAQLTLALQTLVSREINPTDAAVLSVTNIHAGLGSFNVIPASAHLTGTVRTFNSAVRDRIQARMSEVTQGIGAAFGIAGAVTYNRLCDAVINEETCTGYGHEAAVAVAGADNVHDFKPMMGGEDFGGFLAARPGAFIALGQAEPGDPSSPHNFGLHTPQYDFNDAIIPAAVCYFARLAETRMPID